MRFLSHVLLGLIASALIARISDRARHTDNSSLYSSMWAGVLGATISFYFSISVWVLKSGQSRTVFDDQVHFAPSSPILNWFYQHSHAAALATGGLFAVAWQLLRRLRNPVGKQSTDARTSTFNIQDHSPIPSAAWAAAITVSATFLYAVILTSAPEGSATFSWVSVSVLLIFICGRPPKPWKEVAFVIAKPVRILVALTYVAAALQYLCVMAFLIFGDGIVSHYVSSRKIATLALIATLIAASLDWTLRAAASKSFRKNTAGI